MYRKSNFEVLSELVSLPSDASVSDVVWHPLSYYIAGGIDVDGSHTRLDGSPEYDGNRDELPDVFNSPEVLGQPLYDPRISAFDIAEEIGVSSYREATSALQTPILAPDEPSNE